jgi:hypothetical protein
VGDSAADPVGGRDIVGADRIGEFDRSVLSEPVKRLDSPNGWIDH